MKFKRAEISEQPKQLKVFFKINVHLGISWVKEKKKQTKNNSNQHFFLAL